MRKPTTFTLPLGVMMMLSGVRRRWKMPRACMGESASAISRTTKADSTPLSAPYESSSRSRVPGLSSQTMKGIGSSRASRTLRNRESVATEARRAAERTSGVVGARGSRTWTITDLESIASRPRQVVAKPTTSSCSSRW